MLRGYLAGADSIDPTARIFPDNWTPGGNVQHHFNRVLRRLGMADRDGKGQKLRVHSFRHYYATRLVRMGVDPATVRDLLGHTTISITNRDFNVPRSEFFGPWRARLASSEVWHALNATLCSKGSMPMMKGNALMVDPAECADSKGATMGITVNDQYKELCNNSRHIDNRVWLIPTFAYPISFIGIKAAYFLYVEAQGANDTMSDKVGALGTTGSILSGYEAYTMSLGAFIVSLVVVLVFFGFVFGFARYHAYARVNAQEIWRLEHCSSDVVPVIHHSGLKDIDSETAMVCVREDRKREDYGSDPARDRLFPEKTAEEIEGFWKKLLCAITLFHLQLKVACFKNRILHHGHDVDYLHSCGHILFLPSA